MGILVRFKKWLHHDNDIFFRKDEDGRDLFYPWGYPGEAFNVCKTQKKQIIFVLYLMLAIFVIFFYATGMTYKPDNYIRSVWLWITPATVLGSLYCAYVFFLFKSRKLSPSALNEEPGISASFRFLLAMLLGHSGFLIVTISINPNYLPFELALAFILVVYGVLCILAFKNKGFFYTKPPKRR